MIRDASPPTGLSEPDLARFCEYLYRRTGMTFGESKRYYIDRRVADRMAATGDETFAAYFARLRSDGCELEAVTNAFTVNETYFYRELHQFRILSERVLPEVIEGRTPGDRIRILSLPCSTGEEPYSIALWLLENWRMVDAYNIEIDGADIDTAALGAARAGRYGARALSKLPPRVLEDYFEPEHEGRRTIIPDLRESVSFFTANLVDRHSLSAHGLFDVIFCRNVLIYFDDAARRTVAENLYASLAPGGFLLLGHTESMTRLDDRFLTRRLNDGVVYQRPPS